MLKITTRMFAKIITWKLSAYSCLEGVSAHYIVKERYKHLFKNRLVLLHTTFLFVEIT